MSLFLGLAGFERLVAIRRALLVTHLDIFGSGAAGLKLRFQIATRYRAAVKFFGAFVDVGCEHHHQAAGEREERHTCFTFHTPSCQISTEPV